jgi:hypothetical protein
MIISIFFEIFSSCGTVKTNQKGSKRKNDSVLEIRRPAKSSYTSQNTFHTAAVDVEWDT